jgi:hypothetical protein
MYKISDVSSGRVHEDDIVPVDCGTCPVNMACAVGEEATSATTCCRLVAVREHSRKSGILIDCDRNRFRTRRITILSDTVVCSLCSGRIVNVAAYDEKILWIPTVYAAHPVSERVKIMKREQVKVSERLSAEAARKRALRDVLDGDV